jgi:hypothetical protein
VCIKKYEMGHMSDRKGAYRVLVGRPEGKGHFEDLSIDGSIILKMDVQEVG